MYSKTWWKYSAATIGLLAFSLILTYQKPTVRKYQAWHRDITQEVYSNPVSQLVVHLSAMKERMAYYALDQGLTPFSESIDEQTRVLLELKQEFFERLERIDPLIAELRSEWQQDYKDRKDLIIFQARLISRRTAESATHLYNPVTLISAEELERILGSRNHAELIQTAIEKFITFDIATTSVHIMIDMHLQSQVSLEERTALVQHARQSKDAIVALKRAAPTLGLVPELQKRHNAAASLFEFTTSAVVQSQN